MYLPRSPELGVEFERLVDAREARLAPLVLAVDELLEQQRLREVSEHGQTLKQAVEAAARDAPGLDVPVSVSVDLSRPTPGTHLAERDAWPNGWPTTRCCAHRPGTCYPGRR